MMDESVPDELYSLQKWFGALISSPISELSEKHSVPVLEKEFGQDVKILVSEGPFFEPEERAGIYRLRYWERLLTLFQESFPGLLRLFGYEEFNKRLAVPYLMAYPPKGWNLNELAKGFPAWLQDNYVAEDCDLVRVVAKVDYAYDYLFSVLDYPGLSKVDSELIFLQPTVTLLKAKFDVFTFRKFLLEKDVEYWTRSDFPNVIFDRVRYYVLYRHQSSLLYKEIELGQYRLLKAFEMGVTLENALSVIMELPSEERMHAEESLGDWFQAYSQKKWLTTVKY